MRPKAKWRFLPGIAVIAALHCGLPRVVHAQLTYRSQRVVGTGNVWLSLTTDGTIGVLGASNLLDWSIGLYNEPNFTFFLGPNSGNNSYVGVVGTAFSATATELLFDFDSDFEVLPGWRYGFVLFQSNSTAFYCLDISGCGGQGESMAAVAWNVDPTNTPQRGLQVIAAVFDSVGTLPDSSAVPEPATMTLLATGLAGMAAALRKQRKV